MSKPVLCPACGEAMNHHTDQIMYVDEGEQIEEFYQCSNCGTAANRKAQEQDALDAA